MLQVLREQGLGMHIDEDFIAAATAEMQEAMNMSPAEFEAAAEQLLLAEKGGAFRSVLVYKKAMFFLTCTEFLRCFQFFPAKKYQLKNLLKGVSHDR